MGLGPTHLDGPVVLLLAHLDALQQLHVAVPHVAPRGHKHPETSVHLPRHRRLEPVIRLLSGYHVIQTVLSTLRLVRLSETWHRLITTHFSTLERSLKQSLSLR